MEQEENTSSGVAEQVGVHHAVNQNNLAASQNQQMQYQFNESDRTLAEAQLDVNETLMDIYHSLRQDVQRFNPVTNTLEWMQITDLKKRVLTEEGVDRIMQVCKSYVNKETLLSNFDDKMINRRMLEFSLALSGLLFMKYEVYFRIPTLDECHEILKSRLNDKIKKKEIVYSILGVDYDRKKIKGEVLKEMENRIEQEIQKIKQEQTKLNLREFEMIFVQVKSLVEATHNRAWKGEERGSLRRHFNISEVIGGQPNFLPQKKQKGWFGI